MCQCSLLSTKVYTVLQMGVENRKENTAKKYYRKERLYLKRNMNKGTCGL